MPLSEIPEGKTVRVARIDAGHGLKNRLAALGILPNETLHIVRNQGAGQMIVMIKNSKVIIGRGASQKIMVEE